MKPFKTFAIAALAASVAGTALTAGLPAMAQGAPAARDGGGQMEPAFAPAFAHMGDWRGKRGPGRGARAERLFERFDADQDGVITKEEILEIKTRDFASADTDGNGEISLEEFKAQFLERSRDRMVRAFQFLDRDGDGSVTQAEADKVANRIFSRLDKDGNGAVERVRGPRGAEAAAAQDGKPDQPAKAGKPERRAEAGKRMGRGGPHQGRGGPARMFMALFDTDGTGSVSREEFDARRADLFALADTDGSGSFTLETFGPLWLELNNQRIVHMFQRADADGSLGLTEEEAGRQLERMMERADRNGDGVITKADFKGGRKGGPKGGPKDGAPWKQRG